MAALRDGCAKGDGANGTTQGRAVSSARRWDPGLADPRFAGPLGRRSGAPWRCAPCIAVPAAPCVARLMPYSDFRSNALSEDLYSAPPQAKRASLRFVKDVFQAIIQGVQG